MPVVTRRRSVGQKTDDAAVQEAVSDAPQERYPKLVTPSNFRKTKPVLYGDGVAHGKVSKTVFHDVFSFLCRCAFDPSYLWFTGSLLLLIESVVCVIIINKVKYTEIDWSTYMQQAQHFANGTRDYTKIKGDTGPIPYPAGHLYAYWLLSKVTEGGKNILLGQYIFAGFYLVTIGLVLAIANKMTTLPPYVLVLSSVLAYRVHSIFVLRLFNDPLAQMLFYGAVLLLLHRRFVLASVLYSLAVSIKMNVLLSAPGLFVVLVVQKGYLKSFAYIALCALVQLCAGAPFLSTYPLEYISRSFNLGRVFLYEWTVNWRFLPENVFLDSRLHLLLLGAHLFALSIFAFKCWIRQYGGVKKALFSKGPLMQLTANEVVFVLFSSNFIGMVFARSLHYQFYVWYYHTLPFLLCNTKLHPVISVCLMAALEVCWNTYPSTVWSSAGMHALHLVMLVAMFYAKRRMYGGRHGNGYTNGGTHTSGKYVK